MRVGPIAIDALHIVLLPEQPVLDHEEDKEAESHREDSGGQFVLLGVCFQVVGYEPKHGGFLPKEEERHHTSLHETLSVNCEQDKSEEVAKEDEEKDLKDETKLEGEHCQG